jgi:hypothetical protein
VKTSTSLSINTSIRKRNIQSGGNTDNEDESNEDNESNEDDTKTDDEIRQLLRETHQKVTDYSIKREQKYDLSSCSVIDSFIFHYIHTWNNKSHRSETEYLRMKQSKDPTGRLEKVALEEWELTRVMLELNQKYYKISNSMAKERHLIKCNLNPGVTMQVTRSKTGQINMKKV